MLLYGAPQSSEMEVVQLADEKAVFGEGHSLWCFPVEVVIYVHDEQETETALSLENSKVGSNLDERSP